MMEVKCKKTDCGYNNNTVCMADNITIGSFQGCMKYTAEDVKGYLVNKKEVRKINRFETSEDMTEYIHSDKNVNCNCMDCNFNCDKNCVCNGITLGKGENTGVCLSYIEK